MMKRRHFLKLTPAAAMAYMINGLPINAIAQNPLLQKIAAKAESNGRVLVLIQMNGGNDGLNTIIPLDQYSALSDARANILIPEKQVLKLNHFQQTGMHPAMGRIKQMFEEGMMNITQGTGYPDPNFSHFRSSDIWLTGSDSSAVLETGWMGRFLDYEYEGYPIDYPNSAMPDPLALQVGTFVSPVVKGPSVNMGMAIADINSFYNILNNTVDPAPATPAGNELTFLRFVSQQTQQYTTVIQSAAANAKNLSSLYTKGNPLAAQLQVIARLIAGGLRTPIYIATHNGFDTHSGQVVGGDHTTGVHAQLLNQLSEAVYAFYDDLRKLGIDNRVASMAFSEFGRRIVSNSSGGTDHGTAAPVMVFGTGVIPGFNGKNPEIDKNVDVEDNLDMQNDYRSVYNAILQDWFELDKDKSTEILLKEFPVLPIFKKKYEGTGAENLLGQNYPNPFIFYTTIPFYTAGGSTNIQLFDMSGKMVRQLVQQDYTAGNYQVTVNRDGLVAGIYSCVLTNGKSNSSRQLLVMD